MVCGAFALASGCGSDDGKKASDGEQAGAAGANEGGGPSSGGSQSTPAGAGGEPDTSQAGAGVGGNAGAGAGGVPTSGEGGASGEVGAGGAPVLAECNTSGTVTALSLVTEPIYQGCRGSLVHVPFSATDSTSTFACCGVSTSEPAFGAPVRGESNQDGGGDLLLEVPADAPFGSYGVDLRCPTTATAHSFALEINDAAPPVVTSVTQAVGSGDTMVVTGENLDTVTSITAFRARDAAIAFCSIDGASQTPTSVSCFFDGITPSQDATDLYVLDVSNDTCGSALNRAEFRAVLNTR